MPGAGTRQIVQGLGCTLTVPAAPLLPRGLDSCQVWLKDHKSLMLINIPLSGSA